MVKRIFVTGCLALLAVLATCGPRPTAGPLGPSVPGAGSALDAEAQSWVDETLASLTLREKVGQLIVVWTLGNYVATSSPEFEELTGLIVDQGIGGVVVSVGTPHEFVAKLNALQRLASVPLLVASDFEYGPGTRLGGIYALPYLLSLGGGTMFPPLMAFGAIGDERYAYELGRITGLEGRAVGVHLNFGPVLDVNSNPENPIINTRSFGEDPELVARLGAAFIRGARAAGLMTTAKHYPGHGDTHVDSHIDLPQTAATRERLDTLELVPFERAVEVGIDAIMTAHIAAPDILGPDAAPATLSPYFLDGVLRGEFGFEGLIITDAIRMGAIVSEYGTGEAAVRTLEAGADIILMPVDVTETIDAVAAAVLDGRLAEERVDEAVRRVLEVKARAGLNKGRLVDWEALSEVVGNREHVAFADSVAELSITLPRDHDGIVPLDRSGVGRVLSVIFARRNDPVAGRAFNGIIAGAADSLEAVWLDYGTHPATYDSLAAIADSADLVLVSVYVSPSAGEGTVAVPESFAAFVNGLVAAGHRAAVLSFGNPYLLTDFPDVGTYLIAWGGRDISQRAAARALLGKAAITGSLPISLPPYHQAGDGLVRRATVASEPARR
jgi:beta-N-acetylhexosaminidase